MFKRFIAWRKREALVAELRTLTRSRVYHYAGEARLIAKLNQGN